MKAKYLRLNKFRTTAEIQPLAFGQNGHDLEKGMRAVRAPAVVVKKLPTLHRKSNGESVPISRSHEALRYGVDLARVDFDTFDAWLVQLLDWLQNEGVA